MVGAAGLEPAPPCSQSRCATSALRSDMAASTMLTAPPAGEAQQEPAGNVEAVIPMTTAPATTKVKTAVFRSITDTSRPQSRRRQGRVTVAAGQGGGKKSPASGCPSAGPPDRKRHPTTFDQEQFHECR